MYPAPSLMWLQCPFQSVQQCLNNYLRASMFKLTALNMARIVFNFTLESSPAHRIITGLFETFMA